MSDEQGTRCTKTFKNSIGTGLRDHRTTGQRDNGPLLVVCCRTGRLTCQVLRLWEQRWALDLFNGASDGKWACFQDVCVDCCRIEIVMAEQFLDGPDVRSGKQEVGGEAVPVMPSSA